MDSRKVTEKKIEYVLALRTVVREIGAMNRCEENLEAMSQIENALNKCISEPVEHSPHFPALVPA